MDEHTKSINLRIPNDKESGEYCDNLLVFHSANGFRIDFFQIDPQNEEQNNTMTTNGLIVSRLHIPVKAMRNMIDALSTNLQNYEEQLNKGEIQ